MKNNVIYKRLKALWDAGRATETTIKNAVNRGWITQDEANEIMGIVEDEPVAEETHTEEV